MCSFFLVHVQNFLCLVECYSLLWLVLSSCQPHVRTPNDTNSSTVSPVLRYWPFLLTSLRWIIFALIAGDLLHPPNLQLSPRRFANSGSSNPSSAPRGSGSMGFHSLGRANCNFLCSSSYPPLSSPNPTQLFSPPVVIANLNEEAHFLLVLAHEFSTASIRRKYFIFKESFDPCPPDRCPGASSGHSMLTKIRRLQHHGKGSKVGRQAQVGGYLPLSCAPGD
jgi:hypothetical protein